MDYNEALEYLRNLTTFGMNFGLERINKLLELLGSPHKKLKVVHIGGTNGKGSTAAMLNSILCEGGYKVGLFTSPHIHSYRERFKISGEMISEQRVVFLIQEIKPFLEKMVKQGYEHPTEFEVNTAMAFKYFSDERVDIVVLEVGLGGAIDSTNVIDSPLLSVITNVAMDHMDYLGDSLEKIAEVKSGIIKKNRPVITGVDKEEAFKVVENKSRFLHCPLYRLGNNFNYEVVKITDKYTMANVWGLKKYYPKIKVPLLGKHQAKNLAIAVVAAELLNDMGYNKITEEIIYNGLKKVVWNARLEVLKNNRNEPLIVIDAAHNVDGIIHLKEAIQDIFPQKKVTLLIGMLADKEREKAVQIIAPLAEQIIVTKPLSPRAGNWEEIGQMALKYCSRVYIIPKIEDAIAHAINNTSAHDIIVITGSFYMISEARKILKKS